MPGPGSGSRWVGEQGEEGEPQSLCCLIEVIPFFLLDIFFIYISNAIPKVPYTLPLLPNPPTPSSWPWHFPILGHRIFERPRASPPIDGRLGHSLLQMQLETQLWGLLVSSYEEQQLYIKEEGVIS